MGKSSPKTQITEYMMSVHIGIAYAVDAITGVWVNEKEAWTGRSTTQEDILINKPDLFGGQKKEGGLVGYICHLPGRADQVMPAHLTGRYNRTPETSPAYRGLTTLFFVGGGPVVTGQTSFPGSLLQLAYQKALEAQNAPRSGFSWSYNNPVVAQTIWVRCERAPGNGPGSQVILDPTKAMIGTDANPAHMIVECLTNTAWGMGSPASSINVSKFNAAAQALHDEGFGLSMKWTRSAKIEDFVNEILDHIQATLFLNPRTGLWELKLLRADYDVGSLRTIKPDNAKLTNYQRRLWGEAGNQVVVTWTDPANEQDATITAEDLGAINSQGGSPVSVSRNYYGIRNPDLAYRVARRDVRSVAAPLMTASAEVNREFWDVLPGDVLVLNWPEKSILNLVMRVMAIDKGTPDSGKIKLSLLQDIFSLDHPSVGSPQEGGWVDPGQPPAPISAVEVITLPAYFVMSADLQTTAVDLEYPEVLAAVLAYEENPDVRGYGLYAEQTVSGGSPVFVSHGTKSIVERTVLPSPLAWATESRIQDALVLNRSRGPQVGGFMFFGVGSDANMEIAEVTGYDDDTAEWIISRGVLDTVPRAWTTGTPVWFVNPGTRIVDENGLRSVGETVDYKLLPRTSKGVLDPADADIVTETLTARPHLPLRPGNVKVNGVASGSLDGSAATTLLATWATRNRQLEDGQVVFWPAGTIAPEYEQGTVVSVYDQNGALVYEQWGLWTEQQLVLQRSWFDRYSAITIRVSSRRRDLDSLQGHSIQVIGLPANAAAPLPPTPPTPGPPPSPDPAPAVGAWAATGSQFTLDDNGKVLAAVPAILVSGARDRVTAVALVVRYAKAGSGDLDWFTLPEVPLTDEPMQTGTSAVAALTDYEVQVAYQSASNILSAWRSLGVVKTGAAIANQVQTIGGKTPAQVIAELDSAAAQGSALTQTALELSMRLLEERGQLISETYHNGVRVKRMLVNDDRQFEDGDKTLWERTDLIAILGPNGQSMILSHDSLMWSETESVAEHVNAVQAQIGTDIATAVEQTKTWVNTLSAGAQWIQQLEVNFGGNFRGSVTQMASVTSDLGASWTLALNVNNHVSGIYSHNNGLLSSIVFVADQIGFANGPTTRYPFTIVGGKVVATNFQADDIRANTVTATMVVADNITQTTVSTNDGAVAMGAGYALLGEHVAFCSGGPVDLDIWINIQNQGGGSIGANMYCEVRDYYSGGLLATTRTWGDYTFDGANGAYNSIPFKTRVRPGAGWRRYRVFGLRAAGGSTLVKDACTIEHRDNKTES